MATDVMGYNIPPGGEEFLEVTGEEVRNLHQGMHIRIDIANIYRFATPYFANACEMRPPMAR